MTSTSTIINILESVHVVLHQRNAAQTKFLSNSSIDIYENIHVQQINAQSAS